MLDPRSFAEPRRWLCHHGTLGACMVFCIGVVELCHDHIAAIWHLSAELRASVWESSELLTFAAHPYENPLSVLVVFVLTIIVETGAYR